MLLPFSIYMLKPGLSGRLSWDIDRKRTYCRCIVYRPCSSIPPFNNGPAVNYDNGEKAYLQQAHTTELFISEIDDLLKANAITVDDITPVQSYTTPCHLTWGSYINIWIYVTFQHQWNVVFFIFLVYICGCLLYMPVMLVLAGSIEDLLNMVCSNMLPLFVINMGCSTLSTAI